MMFRRTAFNTVRRVLALFTRQTLPPAVGTDLFTRTGRTSLTKFWKVIGNHMLYLASDQD